MAWKNKISLDSDSYNIEGLSNIISDCEELYRNYFKLLEEKNGADTIRIFYPKNGESWIRWNENYSIAINVNLSKVLSFRFCGEGYYYNKKFNNDYNTLKCTYIEKEIFLFNSFSYSEDNAIIWYRW